MKKLTALLALFLLLTLLAQGACAAPAISSDMFYDRDDVTFPQDLSILTGNIQPGNSSSDDPYSIRLSRLYDGDADTQLEIKNSFLAHYDENAKPLDSGYIRKALYLNMELWGNSQQQHEYLYTYDGFIPLHPLLPVSAFIPEGTRFKNLTVYHSSARSEDWKDREAQLWSGKPQYNNENQLLTGNKLGEDFVATSSSNTFVTLSLDHFSPFVIVWDESPAAAPLSVPQTGDSSSLAPWLLLLGGACALLLLAKKKSAASA